MMENNGKNKKQFILSLIGISLLILFSIGITLAFFNYTKVGSRNNVLNTVDLNFSFEDSDWIWLENAYPMSKEEALTLETTGNESVVDVDGGIAQFKVTAAHSSGAIHYILSLVKENITSTTSSQNNIYTLDPSTKIGQLPDGAVSVNLQTSTSDIFETTGLVLDTSGLNIANNSFDSYDRGFVNTNNGIYISNLPEGDLANEKLLGEGVISGAEKSRYFELRMWVNDTVIVDDALRIDCLSRTSQSAVNTNGYGYCSPSTPNLPTGITYVYSSGEFAKLYYSNRIKVQTSNIESGLIDTSPPIIKTMKLSTTPVSDASIAHLYHVPSTTSDSGLFLVESTKKDDYPIYFYRGSVGDNSVIFANYCWRIVRTTETGGIKMIYNGVPNGGKCPKANNFDDIKIATAKFNTSSNSPEYIGFKYNSSPVISYLKDEAETNAIGSIKFGYDVEYQNGQYTLTDYDTANDFEEALNIGRYSHFTCFNNQTSCSTVYYIFSANYEGLEYVALTGGKHETDILNEIDNPNNNQGSNVYNILTEWYENNLDSYSDYLEDTVFCNDRKRSNYGGWDKDKNNFQSTPSFKSINRVVVSMFPEQNESPSLVCPRENDKFTTSTSLGNGKLEYPIGLLTADEYLYAGASSETSKSSINLYLRTKSSQWTMTPYSQKEIWRLDNKGVITNGFLNYDSYDIRPVISLHKDVEFANGDGSSDNPYIVKVIELET